MFSGIVSEGSQRGLSLDSQPVLVALSAIPHAHPEAMEDPLLWTSPGTFARKYLLNADQERDLLNLDERGPLQRFREAFREVSSGVRIQ